MAGEVFAEGMLALRGDGPFAPHPIEEGSDGAEAFAAGEEFLDESQGDAEAFGDLLACGVALVVGVHNALAQVHGDCFHVGEHSIGRSEWLHVS